jgi:tRNA pseudouridine13 synthase
MADHVDEAARPAKRARLDDNSTPAVTGETAFTPKAPAQAPPQDSELEREIRAGITEYVCPDNLGFTGVLKQRYTDFLVNEIGLDGEVLRLRRVGVEKKKKDGRERNGEKNLEKENGTLEEKAKANGTQESEEKVVVREENGDVTMVDGEQTIPVKKEEPIVKQDGEQEAEPKKEEEKPEAEVEVRLQSRSY